MFEQYPYHFKLSILYTLKEKSIVTEYIVENLSDEVMPYFIGGHPGFTCPLLADEAYEDYYLEFENEETCTVPKQFPIQGFRCTRSYTVLARSKTLDLDFKIFWKDAVTLDQLSSRSIRLKSKKHDKGIQLQFKDFPHLILWSTTNKGCRFIALEPWSGLSTSLEESRPILIKNGMYHLLNQSKLIQRALSLKCYGI